MSVTKLNMFNLLSLLLVLTTAVCAIPLKSNAQIKAAAFSTWMTDFELDENIELTHLNVSQLLGTNGRFFGEMDTRRLQQADDPIESDDTLNCYHFPRRFVNGKMELHRYRRCYRKDLDCNVRWRKDVSNFREFCGSIPAKNPEDPLCQRSWEPDVEAEEYCKGKHEKEDYKGARMLPCGEFRGIGSGALCSTFGQSTECPGEPVCKYIVPFLDSPSCHWIWQECSLAFVLRCQWTDFTCYD